MVECERILAFASGDIWARFADSSSVCLHENGATFSTCGGVAEGAVVGDLATAASHTAADADAHTLDRRCQVTRFCTRTWRDKVCALLRFRNSFGARHATSAPPVRPRWTLADALDIGIDVRPLVDADDLLPTHDEFTVRRVCVRCMHALVYSSF